ncbi:hypothetical protein D9757_011902 [Collybiopsis confluens]|uniref:Uncharacterized protein n=1 Tax=Collybiopsis confluens TaxID=2823264 RepID=A0A8H5GG23_9AGAR|nr:hypothetical protein D9757_011902 [Collybiopsis confluens]
MCHSFSNAVHLDWDAYPPNVALIGSGRTVISCEELTVKDTYHRRYPTRVLHDDHRSLMCTSEGFEKTDSDVEVAATEVPEHSIRTRNQRCHNVLIPGGRRKDQIPGKFFTHSLDLSSLNSQALRNFFDNHSEKEITRRARAEATPAGIAHNPGGSSLSPQVARSLRTNQPFPRPLSRREIFSRLFYNDECKEKPINAGWEAAQKDDEKMAQIEQLFGAEKVCGGIPAVTYQRKYCSSLIAENISDMISRSVSDVISRNISEMILVHPLVSGSPRTHDSAGRYYTQKYLPSSDPALTTAKRASHTHSHDLSLSFVKSPSSFPLSQSPELASTSTSPDVARNPRFKQFSSVVHTMELR